MALFGRFRKQDPQGTASEPEVVLPTPIVSLAKAAEVSLIKRGAGGERAAVYLVADHSGSMDGHYRDGSMQKLAEEVLGMAVNLDDDGIVPVVFFEARAYRPQEIGLDNYQGWVQQAHQAVGWGSTNYVAAMDTVAQHYKKAYTDDPALVIFQTDGRPDDARAVEKALRDYSSQPIFWFFVGFGPHAGYLDSLPILTGRRFNNTAVFQAGADPKKASPASLYEALSMGFSNMLAASRSAGVLR